MGFINRLLGAEPERGGRRPGTIPAGGDAHALERYRYMLQTAPPETIEQAHAEAFAQLTAEQRRQVLTELAKVAPPHERSFIEATPHDDAYAVARVATRAEIGQPGVIERTLGGSPAIGFGANLLSSFAMGFAGSLVAQSFFSSLTAFGEDTGTHRAEAQSAPERDDTWDEDGVYDDGRDTDADVASDFDI